MAKCSNTYGHIFCAWKGYDATTGKTRKRWSAFVCIFCRGRR